MAFFGQSISSRRYPSCSRSGGSLNNPESLDMSNILENFIHSPSLPSSFKSRINTGRGGISASESSRIRLRITGQFFGVWIQQLNVLLLNSITLSESFKSSVEWRKNENCASDSVSAHRLLSTARTLLTFDDYSSQKSTIFKNRKRSAGDSTSLNQHDLKSVKDGISSTTTLPKEERHRRGPAPPSRPRNNSANTLA